MTDNEIITAVAELDGRTSFGMVELPTHPIEMVREELPAYLTSRDAIVPVIEKQSDTLKICVAIELLRPIEKSWSDRRYLQCLTATPRQLCEALLRTTGKWKE